MELEGNFILNLGVKVFLMKCLKVWWLVFCFSRFGLINVVIIDEGMKYIGEYGGNFYIIMFINCGGSNVGFEYIVKGCNEFWKFEFCYCLFGDVSKLVVSL